MELYRDPVTGYEIRRYAEGRKETPNCISPVKTSPWTTNTSSS